MIRLISKKYSDLFGKSVQIFLVLSLISCKSSPIANVANYIYLSPVIDGKMDTMWYKVPDVKLNNYNLGTENVKDSNDLSADFRIAWDSSRLYLLVKVTDDIKFDVSKVKCAMDIPRGYECDCIELCFDAKNRKINKLGSFDIKDGDSRYEFVYDRKGITGTFKSNKGIVFAQSDAPDGYMFEIAIPFETLSILPKPDCTFGFEISIYDNDYSPDLPFYNFDNRSAISWSQKQGAEAWRNTGLLGNITLSKNKN